MMSTIEEKSAKRIETLRLMDLKELFHMPKGVLHDTDSIAKAMQMYKIFNLSYLVMVDQDDKVIGTLREDIVLEYCYNLLQRTTGKTSSRYELAYHLIGDFTASTSPVLHMEDSVDKMIGFILNTNYNVFPIVDEQDKLIGTISCRDLLEGHNEGIIQIIKNK